MKINKKYLVLSFLISISLFLGLSQTINSGNSKNNSKNSESYIEESSSERNKESKKIPKINNLTAKKIETNKVSLSWDSLDGYNNYEILKTTNSDNTLNSLKSIAVVNGTNFTDDNLIFNKKYYYSVRAIKINGSSQIRGEVSTPIIVSTYINAPRIKNFKIMKNNSVSLYWDSVPGASGYELHRSNSVFPGYVLACDTPLLTFLDKDLDQNKKYNYKIRAYSIDKNGEKVYSNYSNSFKVSFPN